MMEGSSKGGVPGMPHGVPMMIPWMGMSGMTGVPGMPTACPVLVLPLLRPLRRQCPPLAWPPFHPQVTTRSRSSRRAAGTTTPTPAPASAHEEENERSADAAPVGD
jgi:hypothetical protein